MRASHLALATALLAAATCPAALLVYDGIPIAGAGAYTVGASLNSAASSLADQIGLWPAWTNASTTVLKTSDGGLTPPSGVFFPKLGGGRILFSHTDNAATASRALSRYLYPPVAAQNLYFSGLLRYDDLASWTNGMHAEVGFANQSNPSAFAVPGTATVRARGSTILIF